ncbi:hypothetical protein [Archangium sp.]|jgi:hypothetical protein|uniref:hypothetical protein n=1 Tax=Archangium sp. TaxID=1872627 RepID=UPI002ED94624
MSLSPRSLALLALPLLLLTACPLPGGGGTTPDAGPPPSTPDAGPGDAGSGDAGLHPDTIAPSVFITDPADSLSTTQATVWVTGDALDDVGIVAVERVVGTTVTPLSFTSTGPNSVSFSFEVSLELGPNDIVVRARDAAGRTGVMSVLITREAPPAPRPVINRFSVDKQGVEPGETVVFSWEVSSTTPVTLTLMPYGLDVTGQSQVSLTAPSDDTEYRLVASNAAGTVEQRLLLGVGGPLRLYPERAVIVPGARQRVQALNAKYNSGRWTVSPAGGSLQVTPIYEGAEEQQPYAVFSASAPGTYTLTFTTQETVPRSGSLTLEVRPVASRIARFEGLGGQLAPKSSVYQDALALDSAGALWAVSEQGLGRLDPVSGRWSYVSTRQADGSPDSPQAVVATRDGDVWVWLTQSRGLLRVPAGSRQAEAVQVPWGPFDQVRLHADPTGAGRLWAWWFKWDADGKVLPFLYYRGLGAGGTWTQVSAPLDFEVTAMGVSPSGELFLGGWKQFPRARYSEVFRRDAVSGEWVSLHLMEQQADPLSGLQPNNPVYAFAFQGDTLYAASKGVLVWTKQSGNWDQMLNGLPACNGPVGCEVYDVGLRPGGELLVATTGGSGFNFAGVYWRPQGQASFEVYGTRSGYLNHWSGYAMRELEVTPEGTVFAASLATGVLRLASIFDAWQVAGVQGIPAGCSPLNALTVGHDGTLVVGAGTGPHEGLHRALYRMGPSEDAWTGFGDMIGYEDSSGRFHNMAVDDVALDGSGALTLVTRIGALNRANPGSLGLHLLSGPGPGDGGHAREVEVLSDGTLYVGTDTLDPLVWWRSPTVSSWAAVPALRDLDRLVRTADGALWANSIEKPGAYRLAPGRPGWEWLDNGIPEHSPYVGGYKNGLALDTDGSVLLPTVGAGLFRWDTIAGRWAPVGFGTPSRGVQRVAAGGGRLYVFVEDSASHQTTVFELDRASGAWVPASEGLPQWEWKPRGFEALPDGRLVLLTESTISTCGGVMRSVDAP